MKPRIYLNCPFAEKDQAKALGARWDGGRKQWWIEADADPAPFTRWLPEEPLAASVAPVSAPSIPWANPAQWADEVPNHPAQDIGDWTQIEEVPQSYLDAPAYLGESAFALEESQPTQLSATEEPKGLALSHFLLQVQQILTGQFQRAVWLRAELASLSERNGNLYLELIETNEKGAKVASTRAMIWRADASRILSRFETETGGKLQAGMALLIRASVNFHVQYSFSLTLTEIDASYTQGKAQQQLIALRKKLKDQGLYSKNKAHPLPQEFTHICVISPQNAAGLGDFRAEADFLAAHRLCEFTYLNATFQGDKAALEISQAIEQAKRRYAEKPFDALCIIRGGGSVLDLNYLNHERIVMAAADLPFPLLTGLGHEQDSTLLDEIATRAFDTPSKLALHVEKTIINNAKQAIENMRFIRESIKQKIQQSQLRIQAEQQAIQLLSQQALAWQLNRVKNLAQQLERAAYTQIVQTSRAINDALHTVQQHSRMLLLENHAQLNTQFDYIKQQAGFQLKTQRLSLKHTYQPIAQSAQKTLELKRHALKQFILQVMGRDPTRILHQGYSLARTQQGKVIHTKAQALAAQSFDLMLPDKQTLSVKAQADTPNSP